MNKFRSIFDDGVFMASDFAGLNALFRYFNRKKFLILLFYRQGQNLFLLNRLGTRSSFPMFKCCISGMIPQYKYCAQMIRNYLQ